MREVRVAVLAAVVVAVSTQGAMAGMAGDVVLKAGMAIVVDPAEPGPVRRAVEDLARDCEKVFGVRPATVDSVEKLEGRSGIVVTCTGKRTAELRRADVKGREAHAVFAGQLGGVPHVVLQGADQRGAIYAVYTFCDRVLDVPPLWYWASWQPARKKEIRVPGDFNIRFGSPHVRWRAWFPNDQDLISGWERKSEENFKALFETMLRLKMNVLDVGSISDFPKPNTGLRKARMARDYGLAVTSTHIAPLAASLGSWENYWRQVRKQEPPGLLLANADKFEDFWTYHVQMCMREKLEMIWMVGFRGVKDEGFYAVVTDAPKDDAGRAKAIQNMMHRQVALLKRVTGEEHPVMRTVLYNENSDYLAAGLFQPPDEPSLIWNFCAARRDHFPAMDVLSYRPPADRLIGYYLNLQFTSSGSHLAAGEGPWKIERNYRMVEAIGKRPIEFTVVNMGNTREFVLEASANAAMLWDFASYHSDRFLGEFAQRYFGDEHAKRVGELYREFYQSYWCPRKPAIKDFDRQYIFQDMRLARASERLVDCLAGKEYDANPFKDGARDKGGRYFNIVPGDNGAANQVEAVVKGTADSIRKLEAVVLTADKLMPQMPEGSRAFFNDNLRVQARFMLENNRVLNHLALAMLARRDGKRGEVQEHVAAAEKAAAAMRAALRDAEHGRFAGWYEGDRVFGMASLLERIASLREKLAGS